MSVANHQCATYLEVAAVGDVIEVLDLLLLGKLSQDVHVAVGLLVRGEDVVVRNEDNLVGIPHLNHQVQKGNPLESTNDFDETRVEECSRVWELLWALLQDNSIVQHAHLLLI